MDILPSELTPYQVYVIVSLASIQIAIGFVILFK
jgi:hypothetical protein